MFKKSIVALLVITVSISRAAPGHSSGIDDNPTFQKKENKDGWVKLFDGKSTAGWHSFNDSVVGKAWKVADGVLYFDTTGRRAWTTNQGGDLTTNESFDNFHLKLEWKMPLKGNSGIIFFAQEGPEFKTSWQTGPEMQILDNDGHPDGKIIKHRSGDLYDLIKCTEETVKPTGEWNLAEIIADKGNLQLKLNGKLVVSTTMWNDSWKALIAGSKFKDMPGFGTYKSGKICLQDHGNNVWFRNIMIKKL